MRLVVLDAASGAELALFPWFAEATLRVAPGEYDVLFELEPSFRVEGPKRVTVPGTDELLCTLLDEVPLRDVYIDVVDPDTGQPLRAFEYQLCQGLNGWDYIESNDYHSPTRPALRQHPSDVPLLWSVRAPGRQAAHGRLELDASADDFRLVVPLPKGWGTWLYVSGPDSEPLEGAEVFLDGRLVGRTQLDGTCALGARDVPQRIDVRYRDWTLDPRDSDLELDGTFDASQEVLQAGLVPRR